MNRPASERPPVVEFRGVSKRFGAATALHDVSFRVDDHPDRGEFITMVGASGCGKSTVLNLIAGFITATSGDVLLDGAPVGPPGRDRGMIFQQYSSFPHLTVLRNVRFGLDLAAGEMGLDAGARQARAEELIEAVGLADHRAKYPHQLSGGQQQRLAIARSLAIEPRILLMDEPFSALDEPTRYEMQELLVELWWRRKPTIFCVTHSITEAVYLGERVWIFAPSPGQLAVDFSDNIPPSHGVPPLAAQEQPAFKAAVRAVTETFRECAGRGGKR